MFNNFLDFLSTDFAIWDHKKKVYELLSSRQEPRFIYLHFFYIPEEYISGLDSEVSKAFPLKQLRVGISGGITESTLQKLARNVNGTAVYPTAVYVGSQIVNLLPDMTGSIRSDDSNGLQRSTHFFNGPITTIDNLDDITGVAAYKIIPMENREVRAGVQDAVKEVVAA